MSVETTADELLDDTAEHVEKASENLFKILVDKDVWGADEFSYDYRDKMKEALNHLITAKNILNR